MRKFVVTALLFLLTLGVSLPSRSATTKPGVHVSLRGEVSFTGGGRAFSARDRSDTVVFFQPDAGTKVSPLRGDITMETKDYDFVPHVLAVTVGTRVRFPNFDPIFHNVFSSSAPNNFDLGYYGKSTGKTRVFDHQGLVRVYCNVHHYMFAYILVLNTPYFDNLQDNGQFSLSNLPRGPGELTIWNPQTKVWREHLPALPQTALHVTLEVISHGVPEHSNKQGKSYSYHGPGG